MELDGAVSRVLRAVPGTEFMSDPHGIQDRLRREQPRQEVEREAAEVPDTPSYTSLADAIRRSPEFEPDRQQVLKELGEEPEEERDLDDFLNEPEPEWDWLIPGVLERGDRMILTGREGAGKSVLLGQIAVQVASGIHPFSNEAMDPLRVLLVDLENNPRELRRRFRRLRLTAGSRLNRRQLFPRSRREGLDLLGSQPDQAWVDDQVERTQADLLIIGPIYKLANGEPKDEKDSKPVAMFLDALVADYGCAIVLEGHIPHDEKSGRPFGWSGWRRWPEIGIELRQTGLLNVWRPARHETPALPAALVRGGEWPFTVVERTRELLWAQIKDLFGGAPSRPSEKELAIALGASKSTIHRVLKEHETELMEMFPNDG